MEIVISEIESYFEKSKYPVHIGIDIETPNNPMISITAGKRADNGNLRVFLSFQDIKEILMINNIVGGKNFLIAERDKPTKDYEAKAKRMDDLVYGTLEKYIYQMLKASLNTEFFPEIIPLPKHRKDYWPR